MPIAAEFESKIPVSTFYFGAREIQDGCASKLTSRNDSIIVV